MRQKLDKSYSYDYIVPGLETANRNHKHRFSVKKIIFTALISMSTSSLVGADDTNALAPVRVPEKNAKQTIELSLPPCSLRQIESENSQSERSESTNSSLPILWLDPVIITASRLKTLEEQFELKDQGGDLLDRGIKFGKFKIELRQAEYELNEEELDALRRMKAPEPYMRTEVWMAKNFSFNPNHGAKFWFGEHKRGFVAIKPCDNGLQFMGRFKLPEPYGKNRE